MRIAILSTASLHQEALEKLEETARSMAREIGPSFDAAGAGFALLGFSFGEGGWMTYVSNANRHDMIKALKEMVEKLEAEIDVPPAITGRDPEAQ